MADGDIAALGAELSGLLNLAAKPIGIAFRAEAETPGVAPVGGTRPAPTEDGRTGRGAGVVRVLGHGGEPGLFHGRGRPLQLQRRALYPRLAEPRGGRRGTPTWRRWWVRAGSGRRTFPAFRQVKDKPESIVYGPLGSLPVEPDVIIVRLNAKQAMVLDDALGGVRFEGKPQCHVLAIAKDGGETAISVGCMLSRVRTGMASGEMSCAIPAGEACRSGCGSAAQCGDGADGGGLRRG